MKTIFLTFFIVFLLIFSGCITDQTNTTRSVTTVQLTTVPVSPPTHSAGYSISIDPIQDFQTDSSFMIKGSSLLNVTGTTDLPAGSRLQVNVYSVDHGFVCQTMVKIIGSTSGPNSFSYVYDMKGNPPGQYKIILRDDSMGGSTMAIAEFRIASELPYNAWITINPVGPVSVGKDLPVLGTTNIPPGSEIKIDTGIFLHPCPLHTIPDKEGERSLCGGSCMGTGYSRQTVRVTLGTGNVNTWNATLRTNDWCPGEGYEIDAKAVNWTNVEPAWTLITL